MLDATGNITLNRAEHWTLSFEVEREDGSLTDLQLSDIKLIVSKDGLEIAAPLFTINRYVDPASPTEMHFTFTTEHAAQIGKKEYAWIIREVVAGVPEVLCPGGTITAGGFAV